MKSSYNAQIVRQNLRLYPDQMLTQIELTLSYQNGNVLLRMPATSQRMLDLYQIFRTDSLDELHGQYCRIVLDEETGRVDSMRNIIHDEYGEIQDDPVLQ